MSAKNGSSCCPYLEIILEILGCGGNVVTGDKYQSNFY